MIELSFDPNVAVGPLQLTWHAIFSLIGAVVGSAIGVALVRGRIPFDDAYAVAIVGLVGGLLGSRIFYVVEKMPLFLEHPEGVLAVGDGGESIIGGVVGGTVAAVGFIRRRGLPLGYILDRGAIGLAVGMAIGRIGDVVNGEHHATACAGVAWCVRYTHPLSLGQRDFVHPAVAYELLLDLAIALALFALRRRPSASEGRGFLLFLVLYGAGRIALSAYRLDPIWIGGFTQAQLVSAAFVILGGGALALRERVRLTSA